MQKKLCLMLAFLFALGTIVASLPAVKAQGVRFYVWNATTSNNIYPSKTVGTTFAVEVWIESPSAWDNTNLGIVRYALSVRVDPLAIEVVGASKIPLGGGFLESFLATYGYNLQGYTTTLLVGPVDKATGTILDVSEYILGYRTLGVGAGGGPKKLMSFTFKSRSATIASPIDIFGRSVLEIEAIYTTPDDVDHFVDIMDDGYYIAQTPDKMLLDLIGTLDLAYPIDSRWRELWPVSSNSYTLTSWTDTNATAKLDASDKIQLTNDATGEVTWWLVDWVNPTPTPGDGKTDMSLASMPPPVPEFPLGIGLFLAIVLVIPMVYIWRLRKNKPKTLTAQPNLQGMKQ